MVGPDGTVYYHHSWTPAPPSTFYAWRETGSEFITRWQHPCAFAPFALFAANAGGLVYTVQEGPMLTALDSSTGAIRALEPQPLAHGQTRFAVDADGRLFVNDTASPTCQLHIAP
ncbi:MAG: hypothetical protein AAF628_19480 [Planctomycetota bacterium]